MFYAWFACAHALLSRCHPSSSHRTNHCNIRPVKSTCACMFGLLTFGLRQQHLDTHTQTHTPLTPPYPPLTKSLISFVHHGSGGYSGYGYGEVGPSLGFSSSAVSPRTNSQGFSAVKQIQIWGSDILTLAFDNLGLTLYITSIILLSELLRSVAHSEATKFELDFGEYGWVPSDFISFGGQRWWVQGKW